MGLELSWGLAVWSLYVLPLQAFSCMSERKCLITKYLSSIYTFLNAGLSLCWTLTDCLLAKMNLSWINGTLTGSSLVWDWFNTCPQNTIKYPHPLWKDQSTWSKPMNRTCKHHKTMGSICCEAAVLTNDSTVQLISWHYIFFSTAVCLFLTETVSCFFFNWFIFFMYSAPPLEATMQQVWVKIV